MSLLKIPLLLTSVQFAHLALSPPNEATDDERLKVHGLETVISRTTSIAPFFAKSIAWLWTALEISIIFATRAPEYPTSRRVLHFLTGDAFAPASSFYLSKTYFVGSLCILAGSILRLASYTAMGRNFTFQLALKKDHTLVTSGPYSIVRHPAYIGLFLGMVGTDLAVFAPGSWFRECVWSTAPWQLQWVMLSGVMMQATVVVGFVSRVRKEDAMMEGAFGDEWRAWARRVPYKLIPWIF